MKKYLITYTPNTTTEEYIIEANGEEEALLNWERDYNIISKNIIEHDDSYIDIQKIVE